MDFDHTCDITCEKINHKNATQYPEHVTFYLQEEIENRDILSPLRTPPIDNLHLIPFMTRDNYSSVNRRVIIGVGWPIGHSVNSVVGSDCYLGTEFVLTYPSIDNITNEVLKLGRGCKIFKLDISRDFRHVPIDPGGLDLLGLHWKDYFFDHSLPFEFKHGSSIFQRLSDTVCFTMKQEGHRITQNYIDDFFVCLSANQAVVSLLTTGKTCDGLWQNMPEICA